MASSATSAFFYSNGDFVKSPLDGSCIGTTLEVLAIADRVIALTGGQAKTAAMCGAR